MKIDKKYIVIAVCILIGGVLTATLAFIGPDIITNGTINPNNVVTGNLKLKITDTSITLNNMAPIRSSNYETEAFKKEFTISNAESTLNGCMKLYLNFNSISEQLKSEYLVYKVVSSTGKVSEGSFKDIADNKLLIYDSDFIETGKSISYTLYIWMRYVEDPTINLTSLLGTSIDGYVSVNGSDTKESTSCTFKSTGSINYLVTFLYPNGKVKERRTVVSGKALGTLPTVSSYFTGKDGKGTEYTSTSISNDDVVLYPYVKPTYCTTSGTITQGTEYVNGQYTYRYKQELSSTANTPWININADGWGVVLTDKTSTDPVTGPICTYINDKPVVSAARLYSNSKATSIDISEFNTQNIINLERAFVSVKDTSLDFSIIDTRNATDLGYMFGNYSSILNLKGFDTSKVTNMSGMFAGVSTPTIDLSSFDTRNVEYMVRMFEKNSSTEVIGLENFKTPKLISVTLMFAGAKMKKIDLSNFDTKNVKIFSSMFTAAEATEIIGYENFNTSSATTFGGMFRQTKIKSIDVSKYNTSNVTGMGHMFEGSEATSIIGLNNFDTSKVTDMKQMFANSKATSLDLSSFVINSDTDITNMFSNSSATTGYVKDTTIASKFNDSSVTAKPDSLTFTVKSS